MRIVVNARFLRSDYVNSYGRLQYETLTRIVKNHPEDNFIFLFDKPFDISVKLAENITPLYVSPEAKGPLSWKWWFDIKVQAILRKYKADVFVSMDRFVSLHTKVPQCIVVQDLSFLHMPESFKKSHLSFYKKNTALYLSKAASVAVVSQSIKKDIDAYYKIPHDKFNTIFSGADDVFQIANEQAKENTKEKYTSGYNYFVFSGFLERSSNLITLLKAFSVFKKRQKSSWKLVLTGKFVSVYKDEFLKSLASYKYREDVLVLDAVDENERAALISAAYAMVYPIAYEGFAIPVLEAMQSGVPVIVSNDNSLKEITGDAALFAEVKDPAGVADKMMQLYKDETLRSQLVAKGIDTAKAYSWDKTADLLWESIIKAAK